MDRVTIIQRADGTEVISRQYTDHLKTYSNATTVKCTGNRWEKNERCTAIYTDSIWEVADAKTIAEP